MVKCHIPLRDWTLIRRIGSKQGLASTESKCCRSEFNRYLKLKPVSQEKRTVGCKDGIRDGGEVRKREGKKDKWTLKVWKKSHFTFVWDIYNYFLQCAFFSVTSDITNYETNQKETSTMRERNLKTEIPDSTGLLLKNIHT